MKNVGSIQVTECYVSLWGDGGAVLIDEEDIIALAGVEALNPGQSISYTWDTIDGDLITAGTSYPVKVSAVAVNGGRMDQSLTVLCSS